MEPHTHNEKSNRPGWKEKLTGEQHLPGIEGLDKNAAWAKLYSRLQEKPARIGRARYWVAAASILLISTLLLFITKDQPLDIVKKTRTKSQTDLPAIQPAPGPVQARSIGPAEPTLPMAVVNNVEQRTVKLKNRRPLRLPDEKQSIGPLVRQTYLPQVTIEQKAAEPDVPEPILANAAPVKQKLKVVHINELGAAAPEPHIEQVRDYSFIQIKLITQQVNTGAKASKNIISFNISKSKTTSTN